MQPFSTKSGVSHFFFLISVALWYVSTWFYLLVNFGELLQVVLQEADLLFLGITSFRVVHLSVLLKHNAQLYL